MTKSSDEQKSVWEVLSAVDVSSFTEKKNGLTYLSWAHSWGVLKQHYPDATFEKVMFHNHVGGEKAVSTSVPYTHDAEGNAYVMVTVNAGGMSATETFPVLDHKNKSIQWPDSFSVNTALQRCLAKSIAYLGLGHYVYAGEDLPIEWETYGTGATIKTLDEESHVAQDIKMIRKIFLEFIPLQKTVEDLRNFYKINAEALTILQERGPDEYNEVVGEFTKRTKKLEAEEKKG